MPDTFHLQVQGKHFQVQADSRDEAIQKALAHTGQAPKPKQRADQNFFERFGEDLKTRFGEQGAEIIGRRVQGDQGFMSTALQLTGKVGAGTIMDFLGEALVSGGRGLSNVTPDFIEDPLKENATKAGIMLLNTELGQRGLEAAREGMAAYGEFKEEHPVMAANIEAVTNIGLLVAPVKGKPKPIKPSRAGEALRRSANRSEVQAKREFIDDMVLPKQTAKNRVDQVARTTEEGILKNKKVSLSASQQASAREIRRVRGVSSNKTLQGNYNAIGEAVTRKAKALESSLRGLGDKGKYQWQEFSQKLIDDVGVRLKQNPALVGDAERSAQRVIEHALRLSANEEKTLAGLLRVRKDLDAWVLKHKPKAFDSDSATAMTSAVREVRGQINRFIADRAPNVRVQKSLQSQSRLLRAMDDIAVKAADEGANVVMRAFQRVIKLLPLRGELTSALALTAGVGGLGAAAMFAPFVQKLFLGVGLAYGTRRVAMSPGTRRGLGQLINLIDKAAKKTTDPAVLRQLRADKAAVVQLMKDAQEDDE